MTDPTRLLARLAELRATAEAATPGPWNWTGGGYWTGDLPITEADCDHVANWIPSHSLLWIEWAEDVVRRHAALRSGDGWECGQCTGYQWTHGIAANPGVSVVPEPWPCPEVRGAARALGLEET